MIIFLMLIGLIPGAVWILCSKNARENRIIQYIRAVLFFFLGNCFCGSSVKWYLGNPDNTLSESFWDAQIRTYFHYGIILAVADIAVLVCVCCLMKRWSGRFAGLFNAFMLIFLLTAGLIGGGISNRTYCIVFVAAAVSALLFILRSKSEEIYFSPGEYPGAFLRALPAVGSWMVTVGIYLPNELYINNVGEFTAPYGEFFRILLTGSILIIVLLTLAAVIILPKNFYRGFLFLIFGISIMSYVQEMFLNGKLQSLIGEEQTWSRGTQAVNLLIWMLVVGLVTTGGYYKPAVEKLCRAAGIYLILIQTVTLGYLLITRDVDSASQRQVMTTQGALTLAENDNILVFVLDKFDSADFDDIIAEAPEFVKELSDFTYYRNATSQYAYTECAIPYLLERVESRFDMKEKTLEHMEGEKGDVLMRMHQNGYNIGVYTIADYASEDLRGIAVNYNGSAVYQCDYGKTLRTMLRSSLYKTMPFALKPGYRYSSADTYEIAVIDDAWSILNDLPFYQSMVREGLSVDSTCKSAFRFYHMVGVHPPYYLSEDLHYDGTGKEADYSSQARGCLKIVYEYLNQLKRLGKYDDATIIITADHGMLAKCDMQTGEVITPSSPVMLVKEARESHENMVIRDAPVTQGELMPTIARAAGVDWKEYGRTFDEVGENEQRERAYKYYDPTYEWIIVEYLINGYVKDADSWRVEEAFRIE